MGHRGFRMSADFQNELFKSCVNLDGTRCSDPSLLLLYGHMIDFTSSNCVCPACDCVSSTGALHTPTAVCVRVSPWVFVCAQWCWGGPMAAQTLGTGVSSSRRRGACAAVTLLLLPALLTCRVRCAQQSNRPSNIVLIVTDDQDVVLGGLVSGEKRGERYKQLWTEVISPIFTQKYRNFCLPAWAQSYWQKERIVKFFKKFILN